MSDGKQESAELQVESKTVEPPFLQRTDWLSFAATGFLSLGVFLFTMNPSLDLDFSGIYATGAMYPGVPHPPGFPLWTIYAHLFIKLLPFSNIVWRVNVASAVASALTCGNVALMTSRCSGMLLRDLEGRRKLAPNDESKLRFVCGCIAGLALGFDRIFWSHAVVADSWNFNLLLLALTLCLFLRWQHQPDRTRWFYAGCFMYGLALTQSQALLSATFGIGCLILCVMPAFARDIAAAIALMLGMQLAALKFPFLSAFVIEPPDIDTLFHVYLATCIFTFVAALVLLLTTRKIFTRWRMLIAGILSLVLGLTPYLFVPIFSMTNPPMNWGYPRTVDGFWHVLSRGQYEKPYTAESLSRFVDNLTCYYINTKEHFGLLYVCAAIVPFLFLRYLQKSQRQWLIGLLGVYLSLSIFLVYIINPSLDRASVELNGRFFTSSHLVLAILAGCGLAVTGSLISAPAQSSPILVEKPALKS